MADMIVDGVKLDACLDAEADAIRAKTGGSADIPFDFANNKGFADAIAAIPSGGGLSVSEVTLAADYSSANATSTTLMSLFASAINKNNYVAALKLRDSSKSNQNTFMYGVNITDQGIPTGAGFNFVAFARSDGSGGYTIAKPGGIGATAWAGDVFTVWGWDV